MREDSTPGFMQPLVLSQWKAGKLLGPQDRSQELPGKGIGREVILTSLTASPAADLIRLFSVRAESRRELARSFSESWRHVSWLRAGCNTSFQNKLQVPRTATFTKLFCRLLNYLLLTRNSGSERAAHFTTRTRMVDLH